MVKKNHFPVRLRPNDIVLSDFWTQILQKKFDFLDFNFFSKFWNFVRALFVGLDPTKCPLWKTKYIILSTLYEC